MKFEPVSLSPSDAEFVAQRKLSTAEIARLFRVPPSLVNAESNTSLTYSTTESEALNFVKFSLAPHLRVIEAAISSDADLCPGSIYVQFVLDALLRADSLSRVAVHRGGRRRRRGLGRAVFRLAHFLAAKPSGAVQIALGVLQERFAVQVNTGHADLRGVGVKPAVLA